jgi:hypothetical protein
MNAQAEGPPNKPKAPRRAACYLDTRRRAVSAVGGGAGEAGAPPGSGSRSEAAGAAWSTREQGPKGPPTNLNPRDAQPVAR